MKKKNILKKAAHGICIIAAGMLISQTGGAYASELQSPTATPVPTATPAPTTTPAGTETPAPSAKPGIAVNETNFPDSIFRAYVLSGIDTDGDKVLTEAECKKVTQINVRARDISNLKGIEYFTELQTLNVSSNKLSKLDVSSNTKLTYINASNNDITEAVIAKAVSLRTFLCSGNNLNEIDVKDNKFLDTLDLSGNKLQDIDVSANTRLTSLDISDNALVNLNISANTALDSLDAGSNQLTSLDLSKNTELSELNVRDNRITVIDLSANTSLKTVDCSYNNLISFVTGEAVETLMINNNRLYNVSLAKAVNLKKLNVSGNELYNLDISANVGLISLNASDNNLAAVDAKNCPLLTEIAVSGNSREIYVNADGELYIKDTGIDVSKLESLTGATLTGEGEEAKIKVSDVNTLPKEVTYVYNFGNGIKEDFVIIPVNKKMIVPAKSDISLYIEENKTVEYPLSVAFVGEACTVKWASSNVTVAKVSEDGKVTPVGAGTAVITASAEGYASAEFTVNIYNQIQDIEVSDIPMQYYTGAEIKPVPVVKAGTKTLTAGTDYTVTYQNNISAGTAYITITGTGKYAFSVTKSFKICYNIGTLVSEVIPDQTYTGGAATPDVVIKNGTYTLVKDVDYTLSYANNSVVGTGIVTVTGKGNYAGTKIQTFNIIIPQVTGLTKTGNKKMQITLTWNAIPGVHGYRIYKYNATTGKYAYLKQLVGSTTNTYTDTGLTAGNKYCYRVRAYVKVNNVNQYGKYSTKYKTSTRLKKAKLTAKAGTRKASLSWKTINGASGYRIYMSTDGKTFTKIKDVKGGSKKSYTKTGLTKNKTYYFKVRAYRTVVGVNTYGSYSKVKTAKAK